jgi:uncharacterized protein
MNNRNAWFRAAWMAAVLLWAVPAAAREPLPESGPRLLEVTGQGKIILPAAHAVLTMGVEGRAVTAACRWAWAAVRAAAVVQYLKAQKAQKLFTSGVSLSPQFEYRQNGEAPVLKGYLATNTVSARFPVAAAGTVMDGAVNAGASTIQDVAFLAEESQVEKARLDALAKAVQDARVQGDAVLAALGMKAREIHSMEVSHVSPPIQPKIQGRMADLAVMSSESAQSPVLGQEQTVVGYALLKIAY